MDTHTTTHKYNHDQPVDSWQCGALVQPFCFAIVVKYKSSQVGGGLVLFLCLLYFFYPWYSNTVFEKIQ